MNALIDRPPTAAKAQSKYWSEKDVLIKLMVYLEVCPGVHFGLVLLLAFLNLI